MNSAHWNWERISYIEGRGVAAAGKKNVLNNFCLGAQSNELSCAKCHIGFGMTNNHLIFKMHEMLIAWYATTTAMSTPRHHQGQDTLTGKLTLQKLLKV
jgi:hypothetical protein